jgi:arylsulfatase A-like enzyme
MMLNLPETDVTGHFALRNTPVETTLMAHFDRELGSIIAAYREAHLLQHTVFVVTADHGMSSVQARLPFSILDRAVYLAGASKMYLEADTGAAIGIRQLDRARAVALGSLAWEGRRLMGRTINACAPGSGRTPPRTPALSDGAHEAGIQMLANTDASAEGPEVLAVYAPHVTTGDRIAHGYHWWAGHLGPQWDEQHIPLLIAGPGATS